VYTLVSAPVLGFDLSRADGGARAAGILLRALAMEADDLRVLAAHHGDDADRLSAWVEVTRSGEAGPEIGPLVAGLGEAIAAERPVSRSAVALLERARIGTLGSLLRCVRHDVFDWTWSGDGDVTLQSEADARAVAVVCDAVAAAYAQEHLSPSARRRLAAGWLRAQHGLGPVFHDLGPQASDVEALLARVRHVDAADRLRLARAVDRARREGPDWASAVHEATWAVHLSGRVRAAAAAQLLLVEAVASAGVPVEELAAGTWNLLSGAVQAHVVRDVAGAEALHLLLAPYLFALGVSI
jgi:hypothetical protein